MKEVKNCRENTPIIQSDFHIFNPTMLPPPFPFFPILVVGKKMKLQKPQTHTQHNAHRAMHAFILNNRQHEDCIFY